MDSNDAPGGDNRHFETFECNQCSNRYRRREHLIRHEASHTSERLHQCYLCKSAFQRSDVLKRHLNTCNGKRQKTTKTTPRHACDACARSKRGCNGQAPCQVCQRKGVTCSLSTHDCHEYNVPAEPSFDMSLIPYLNESFDLDNTVPGEHIAADVGQSAGKGEAIPQTMSLQFLEAFTREKGLVESFDCLSEAERWSVHSFHESRARESSDLDDIIESMSDEIIRIAKEAIVTKGRRSTVSHSWNQDTEAGCGTFFSPRHVRLYLDMYWAIWHPNVNFMHRPTFELQVCKPILVSAMMVMGAMVSPEKSDRDGATSWATTVEEMVFQDDDFCADIGESDNFPSQERLQSLQAAYIVCLFQNWEGDDSSKRRIRRSRFSTMVAVARDTGIHHARHSEDLAEGGERFMWQDFARREELIRVFLWIFLLDTAFVIFNNLPPRLAIKEMKMHLASSEACFQASTGEECFLHLNLAHDNRQHTAASLCERLCSRPLDEPMVQSLADLGPLNLFALTSALHSLSFQIQQCFGFDKYMTPIRVALDNWIRIWQMFSAYHAEASQHNPMTGMDLSPENMWKRVGFARYAPEYWMLAKLIVDRIYFASQLKEIIDFDASTASTPCKEEKMDSLLDKYDDTSMKQVNDLITEFQKVII